MSDKIQFGKFFQRMLESGVYLAPSQFEAGFVSISHDEQVIDATIDAVMGAFRTIY